MNRVRSIASKKLSAENDQVNDGGKASPYSRIRSPTHWLAYPNVIQGAIQRVTSKIGDVELRRKVVNCLTDVMHNRANMSVAHQTHFQTLCRNDTTPRLCRDEARQLLIHLLGEEKCDKRLKPHLKSDTTFEQLKRIVDSFKNRKSSVKIEHQKSNTAEKALKHANTASQSKAIVASPSASSVDQKKVISGHSAAKKTAAIESVPVRTVSKHKEMPKSDDSNKKAILASSVEQVKLGLIVCCFCDKSVEKHVLWDHIAQDIDYRPFDCETCAQTFINKSELTEHEIKSDGHKGNHTGNMHKFKEEMIRHIFSQSIKSTVILKERVKNSDELDIKVVYEKKVQFDNGLNVGTSQNIRSKDVNEENPRVTKTLQKSVKEQVVELRQLSSGKRRRRSAPYLVSTRGSRQKRRLSELHRRHNPSAAEPSTPASRIHLPSLSPGSSKAKSVDEDARHSTMRTSLDENSKQERSKQTIINVSHHTKSSGKTRVLEYDNGARVEYENIDSDASWETDSDIVVAEKFSSVNNNFSFVRENVNKNISSNKVLTKTSISSFNGIEGLSCSQERNLLACKKSTDMSLPNSIGIPKKTVKSKRKKWNSIKKTPKFIMCKECRKEISNRSTTLQSHINSKHLKLPLYECPRCSKSFYELSDRSAKKHMRKMHGRKSISELINNRMVNSAELKKKAVREKFFGPIENATGSCSSSSKE